VGDLVHQVVHRGIDVRHFLAALRTVAATEWSRAVGALQQINDVRLHAEILPIPWTVESTPRAIREHAASRDLINVFTSRPSEKVGSCSPSSYCLARIAKGIDDCVASQDCAKTRSNSLSVTD